MREKEFKNIREAGTFRMFAKLRHYWGLLNQTIYRGELLERNLVACTLTGAVIAAVGSIMTAMNLLQKKGFVTLTTLFIVIVMFVPVSPSGTGKTFNEST